MEKSTASLIPNILERKVVEKNRRDKMKLLYSQLFSLVPDHFKSKETVEISERVNETINYIESLKANIKKTKEEASTSSQMSHGIEIHEMTPDLYVVVVTGLETPSVFFNIVRVLDGYSTDVVQANFSPRGPSTFHVHHNNVSLLSGSI
ncbi:hypothetical protein E3N88_18415 [Mikania micrantha]|uniref:BHLH domain-containing protein n=1 Tax=Mikania micrantha TaxID=192012 RepID=A0A5N6NLQ9_9ASTR|nr:hypothetical protein E3N88_18415 [Mikania micrantha]